MDNKKIIDSLKISLESVLDSKNRDHQGVVGGDYGPADSLAIELMKLYIISNDSSVINDPEIKSVLNAWLTETEIKSLIKRDLLNFSIEKISPMDFKTAWLNFFTIDELSHIYDVFLGDNSGCVREFSAHTWVRLIKNKDYFEEWVLHTQKTPPHSVVSEFSSNGKNVDFPTFALVNDDDDSAETMKMVIARTPSTIKDIHLFIHRLVHYNKTDVLYALSDANYSFLELMKSSRDSVSLLGGLQMSDAVNYFEKKYPFLVSHNEKTGLPYAEITDDVLAWCLSIVDKNTLEGDLIGLKSVVDNAPHVSDIFNQTGRWKKLINAIERYMLISSAGVTDHSSAPQMVL